MFVGVVVGMRVGMFVFMYVSVGIWECGYVDGCGYGCVLLTVRVYDFGSTCGWLLMSAVLVAVDVLIDDMSSIMRVYMSTNMGSG